MPSGPLDTRLVQFHELLSPEERRRFQATYGLALTCYVPNRTYVERIPAELRTTLAADPAVRAVAPYLPAYKRSGSLEPAGPIRATTGADQVRLVATLFDGGDTAAAVSTGESEGATATVVLDDRPLGGLARVWFSGPDGAPVRSSPSWMGAGSTSPTTSSPTPTTPNPGSTTIRWSERLWPHLNLTMIHPFHDGNGRLARCLQSLVLARAGYLHPGLCSIEDQVAADSQGYYHALMAVEPHEPADRFVRYCLGATSGRRWSGSPRTRPDPTRG